MSSSAAHEKGFTLIELLVVIAIIGILVALGVGGYLQWFRSLQVKQAAVELGEALAQTRVLARQKSVDATLTFDSPHSYTIRTILAGTPPVSTVIRSGDLGPNIVVTYDAGQATGTTVPTSTVITYRAPYSLISDNRALVVTMPGITKTRARVALPGLTGEVSVNANY